MNFLSLRFPRLFSAALFCAAIAGCSPSSEENSSNNAAGNATQNTASNSVQSTPSADAGSAVFTSTAQGLKGKLQKHYVDFSFSYPKDWEAKEIGQSEGAPNYVKLERVLKDDTKDDSKQNKGDFTLENFAVSYFSPPADSAKKAAIYPQLMAQISAPFQKTPGYKKVSEGKTKIGNLEAYEFRFENKIEKSTRGPITNWTRVVLLPRPDAKKGVLLIMIASSLAPEIKSAKDVGEKGQLPTILKSFKFGK